MAKAVMMTRLFCFYLHIRLYHFDFLALLPYWGCRGQVGRFSCGLL